MEGISFGILRCQPRSPGMPLARKMGWPRFAAAVACVLSQRNQSVDPVIGCNVLAEPFFFAREQWIPALISWAPNIVQGKTYDSMASEGAALWREVQQSVAHHAGVAESSVKPEETDANRFGSEYLTRSRLGQGAFRVLVIDAYQRRCAVTGEKTLPVLEAAQSGPMPTRDLIR